MFGRGNPDHRRNVSGDKVMQNVADVKVRLLPFSVSVVALKD